MRQIVLYPNKILRIKTAKITKVDQQLKKEIRELKTVLGDKSKSAAGLAAPQIGISRRFFGMVRGNGKGIRVFINPVIEKVWGDRVRPMMVFEDGKKDVFLEGCLSFPEVFGVVKRYLKIEVAWEEIKGEVLVKKRTELAGIEAIAFQHESEHLDGILLVDHFQKDGGELYKWVEGKKVEWDVNKLICLEK